MKLMRAVAVFSVLAIATAGITSAQEKGKSRGQLPPNWGKLGLSEEQKKKIHDIHDKHQTKIDELEKQIKDHKDNMKKEQLAVLTADQKNKLKEIAVGEGDEKKK